MKKLKDLSLENVNVSELMTAKQMNEIKGGVAASECAGGWCTDGMCTNHLCTGGWCTGGMCNTQARCLL